MPTFLGSLCICTLANVFCTLSRSDRRPSVRSGVRYGIRIGKRSRSGVSRLLLRSREGRVLAELGEPIDGWRHALDPGGR